MDSPLGPYSWIPRILSIFDKMREHQPFKAPAKNYENRAWVCTYFNNYLAWLTGIKKLIFHSNNFLAPAIFRSLFKISWIKKIARAKKLVTIKISFFTPIIHIREFWKSVHISVVFLYFWPELHMAAFTPREKNFDCKLVGIVLTTFTIEILGLILNFRAMGLT